VNRSGRCVYIYLRAAFSAYAVLLPVVLVATWFDYYQFSSSIAILAIAVVLFISPAFMILPGLMYVGDRPSYFGLNMDDTEYGLFALFTLGYGPVLAYFQNHDKALKAYSERDT